jgi:hypothetical protein
MKRHDIVWPRLTATIGLLCSLAFSACGPVDAHEQELEVEVLHQELYDGDLGKALGTPVRTNHTCGMNSDYQPNCSFSNNAPDASYSWTAPCSGKFLFTTTGSDFDTILDIRPLNNTGGTSLGCNDDSNGTLQSSLELWLTAGQQVMIIIDGYNTRCGNHRLNITNPGQTCSSACNSPPNSCYESTGISTSSGCLYNPKPAGAACNDGLSCTANDVCNGAGACQGTTTCGSPPGSCYEPVGACSSSGCVYALKPSGAACNDGSSCTINDVCNGSGVCKGVNNCSCQVFTGSSDFSYEDACASASDQGQAYCESRGGVNSTSLCKLKATDTPPYIGERTFCCNG